MTPTEFKALQHQIGCTGARLSEWLGVTPTTISFWRNGLRPVTGPAALAMKALASGWRP